MDKVNNDIYFGLDKELVRAAVAFASMNEEDFYVMPIPVEFEKETGELYTNFADDRMKIELSEEQVTYIKETKNPIIRAYIIKENEVYSTVAFIGDDEEEIEEDIDDFTVENFIEYKGITTKEELQNYISEFEKKFHLGEIMDAKDFNSLKEEERIEWGREIYFNKTKCLICGEELIEMFSNKVEKNINVNMYACDTCENVYTVVTDDYGTVTNCGIIPKETGKQRHTSKKKKKKKKVKKTYGKRK